MSVAIDLLASADHDQYERLVRSRDTGMIYASLKYRTFLQRILPDSEPVYLAAHDGPRMLGALPAFIRRNAKYGNVLNSLPFYGSPGGVIVSPDTPNAGEVKRALLREFQSLAGRERAAASTIISSPLDPDSEFYAVNAQHTVRDERIGQITYLPVHVSDGDELRAALMEGFHQKTRNSIRKAEKSGVLVSHSDSLDALRQLAAIHRENIEALRGIAKPVDVFLSIRQVFAYDTDYRVYVAEKDGQSVAWLLVFFYHRTAEYYVPAVLDGYRSYQPMSLLVFHAMQDAAQHGCCYWNWGGTWKTQPGVYRFKARFGAVDRPYYYFTQERDRSLRRLKREVLLSEYPLCYVVPFDVLEP
jgi:hypothetical protein